MTFTLEYDDKIEIEKEARKVFVRIFAERYLETLELDNLDEYSQKDIFKIYHDFQTHVVNAIVTDYPKYLDE